MCNVKMTAGKKSYIQNVTLNCRNFRYNDHNDLHGRYFVIGPFFVPSSQDIIRIALFHIHMVFDKVWLSTWANPQGPKGYISFLWWVADCCLAVMDWLQNLSTGTSLFPWSAVLCHISNILWQQSNIYFVPSVIWQGKTKLRRYPVFDSFCQREKRWLQRQYTNNVTDLNQSA